MKAAPPKITSLTPWHLRERTRGLGRDLSKTIQSNFFYSFLFLPRPKREAIMDVYSVCRAVDDVVDEAEADGVGAGPLLELWRRELAACYDGRPTLPQTLRLRRTLDRFPIPQEYFEDLIVGCRMDLTRSRYQTFDDLYEYCYHVASVVGLICVEIFTYSSPLTRDYAVNLGVALQLTNILRDLKEDAARGRVYLPQEDLKRFDYSEQDLRDEVINESFRELMRFECARARDYYRRAAEVMPAEDRPTLVAAQTMGRIYFRLLGQIERVGYDVFRQQVRLHRPERFLIALSEWAGVGGGGRVLGNGKS
ncbi:MAG TPA: presqualene diphosphate synthase HpnD [Blastocatellia bacterium]|nr:presqualene diphosphate synthase HpnD [Blastocatellia bacterium]